MRNLQEQVKKAFCYQTFCDFSLFEQIVLVISKFLQILDLQPRISKVFSITRTIFSHSRSEQFLKQNTSTLNTFSKLYALKPKNSLTVPLERVIDAGFSAGRAKATSLWPLAYTRS